MLQRVQSIYLLLASLAIFALFLFPLVHNFDAGGKQATLMVTGVYDAVSHAQIQAFMGTTIVTPILAILPLVIIFLYKNRKQQIALCYSTLLAIVGYSFWLSREAKTVLGDVQINTHNWGIGLFLSSLSMLLVLLAVRGIKADEKLIKSADRLR